MNLENERRAKMRPANLGKRTRIAAVILAAASFAGQPAAAQATPAPPTPVPAAPAGGIDPSKLPDIQGIYLGTSIPDALAKLTVLYPSKGGFGVTGAYGRFMGTTDAAWQGGMTGVADPCILANQPSCRDTLIIRFNTPPKKQVAISMDRTIGFQNGKYPSPDNVKAALLQKYGPNPIMIGPNELGWVFDEQGKPVAIAGAAATLKIQCAGNVLGPSGTATSAANANLGPSPTTNAPLSQAQVDQWMRDPCRSSVVVLAIVNAAGPYVTVLDVKMSENGEATRDNIVMQEYMDKLGAAQKLQQQKKAQQVAAPKI
jgi:hypothetical protein